MPPELTEELARELHGSYVRRRVSEGENLKHNPSLKPWERLPELLKESNRTAVREFVKRMESIGFALVPEGHPSPGVTAADLQPYLELLAQLGHVQWCNERIALGWTYARGKKDLESRTHPSLVPWSDLSASEQEKDREQIADLMTLLKQVRWRITRGANGKSNGDFVDALAAYMFPDAPGHAAATQESYKAELPIQPDLAPEEASGDVERLAKALHEAYVTHRMKDGESVAKNPALRPWQNLPEHLKRSNRQAVGFLLERLATLGYRVVPVASPKSAESPPVSDFGSQVEMLSKMAHTRWLNERTAAGWMPGAKDPARRTHPFLLAWEFLPEEERQKSREQVQDLPRILAMAGLRLERLRPQVPQVAAAQESNKKTGFFRALFPSRD